MNEETYRVWWALHLRVARGESLTEAEAAAYQTGVQPLHQEELLTDNVAALRQLRSAVAALEAERQQLRARRHQVEAEIAMLEKLIGSTNCSVDQPSRLTLWPIRSTTRYDKSITTVAGIVMSPKSTLAAN
jgi:hypothetical protein